MLPDKSDHKQGMYSWWPYRACKQGTVQVLRIPIRRDRSQCSSGWHFNWGKNTYNINKLYDRCVWHQRESGHLCLRDDQERRGPRKQGQVSCPALTAAWAGRELLVRNRGTGCVGLRPGGLSGPCWEVQALSCRGRKLDTFQTNLKVMCIKLFSNFLFHLYNNCIEYILWINY